MERLYHRYSFRQAVHNFVKNDDDDDDDDDDEVLDAAAAIINASVYTPVYIKLINTYPMMIVEIDRI